MLHFGPKKASMIIGQRTIIGGVHLAPGLLLLRLPLRLLALARAFGLSGVLLALLRLLDHLGYCISVKELSL